MPLNPFRVPDHWGTLVATWGTLLDKYEHESQPQRDVAYWHSEWALTASLAAAAWVSGGTGLVEFSTKRRRTPSDPTRAGFGDAWLKVEGKWYAIEAKIAWSEAEITEAFQHARADLLTLGEDDRGDEGLALCYCVPYFYRAAARGDVIGIADNAQRQFATAQIVLGYTPDGPIPHDDDEGADCPGMVVIGEFLVWPPQ